MVADAKGQRVASRHDSIDRAVVLKQVLGHTGDRKVVRIEPEAFHGIGEPKRLVDAVWATDVGTDEIAVGVDSGPTPLAVV